MREQQIAANVFNRKPDYNPGQDNIVRVEARSLRKRLETYFATEGKDERIVMSMPKGSYAICFEPRPADFEATPPPVEIAFAEEMPAVKPRRSPWVLGVCCVVLAALAGGISRQWLLKRAGARPNLRTRTGPNLTLPFSALIEPD